MKGCFIFLLAVFTFSRLLAGETATAFARITAGFVSGITVTSGGSGYTGEPAVALSGGGGSGASVKAIMAGDKVALILVLTAGSGYTGSLTVVVEAPPKPLGVRSELVPKLTVDGPAGSKAQVESAASLSGPWTMWTNVTVGSKGTVLVDLSPRAELRFYRAIAEDNPAGPAVAPVITTQPQLVTVTVGQPVQFGVTATGTGPLAYQWQHNSQNISGATGPTYTIPSAQLASAGDYRVVVGNATGNVTSVVVNLTVNAADPAGPVGFVWIKPGTFVMGSPTSDPDRGTDELQHSVSLSRGYWMSDHEVTQAEYEAVMGSNPSNWRGLNLPVENVSWDDAVLYCEKLTARELAAGRIVAGIVAGQAYRLPTEAEWEYAARAGTTGVRHGELDAIAWWYGNSGKKIHPVKQKAPNAWGLYDMIGNVWELCSDWYNIYPTGSVTDPTGWVPEDSWGQFHVCRGGSWYELHWDAGSAYRRRSAAGVYSMGFRPVLSVVAKMPRIRGVMAPIPAGRFQMGDDRVGDATPVHPVTVSAFLMDQCEVSIELWDSVRVWGNAHGYDDLSFGENGSGNYPVESVTWYDVVKWNNARSEKEGKVPAYYVDASMTQVYRSGEKAPAGVKWNTGYRLPTEAEWEYAARGGVEGKLYPWGTDEISHNMVSYYETLPSPIGTYGANGYGLYDMAGNVSEWCWDWDGNYSSTARTDPRGPSSGWFRVNRGGSFSSGPESSRVASRGSSFPDSKYEKIGFRSVLSSGQP